MKMFKEMLSPVRRKVSWFMDGGAEARKLWSDHVIAMEIFSSDADLAKLEIRRKK